jgi:hypothetical protein
MYTVTAVYIDLPPQPGGGFFPLSRSGWANLSLVFWAPVSGGTSDLVALNMSTSMSIERFVFCLCEKSDGVTSGRLVG